MNGQKDTKICGILKEMKKLIYTDAAVSVLNDVKGRDIVMFLGNTKSGKSTIVNHVIGNHLKAVKVEIKKFHIVKDSTSPGPIIGRNSTSETTTPSSWNSTIGLIVDAPGFDDNRGVAQDIANAFYIMEILKNIKSFKLVLISDIVDIISDSINPFIGFIDKIHHMLPHDGQLHTGVIMVFNKDKDNYTNEDISETLKEKILEQPSIQVKNRQLAEYLHRNPKKIVVVKTPKAAGSLNDEIFNDLTKSIQKEVGNVQSSEMPTPIPAISDRSYAFLLKAFCHLLEPNYIDQVLDTAYNAFSDQLKKFDVNKDHSSEASSQMLSLRKGIEVLEERIKTIINNLMSDSEKLKELGLLLPMVTELKEDSGLYVKLKFIEFIDSVIKVQESAIFSVKISSVLFRMLDGAARRKTDLQEKLMEITKDAAKIQIDDLNKKLEEVVQESNEKIKQLESENEKSLKKEELKFFARIGQSVDDVLSKTLDLVSNVRDALIGQFQKLPFML